MTKPRPRAKPAASRSRGRSEAVSRGDRNVAWIEHWCRIPEGRDVGKPVRLREWQKDIIRSIYDNPAGTRRAIISFGRKNAKTTLSAFLTLLHLCGPEARPNSQLFSAAQSKEQASVLFALAAKMVRMNPELVSVVVVRDTTKQLFCPDLGSLYRALSAEASTAYGLSPSLIIHDELGQVRGPRSELYEALETATGAQDNPLSIVISTQAPTDADLMSVLIDRALTAKNPREMVFLYSAPPELETFSVEAIKAANPAYGDFLSADEVEQMRYDAMSSPSAQPGYENLVLNRRVEAVSPFVSRPLWKACGGDVVDLRGEPVWIGLDLSTTNDLTALVMIGRISGVWHVQPTFWLPGDGLADKARKDRVSYDVWRDQGFLNAAPGKSVDYEFVAAHVAKVFDEYDVQKVAFDRWAFKHLKPWLERAGLTVEQLEQFEEFGQGFQSMSPALRELEAEILNVRVAHGNHPVLTMCAANARVQTDPAGNRKLDKMRSTGRIDGMVALAMAFGVAPMESDGGPSVYETRGVLML